MPPLLFALSAADGLAQSLAGALGAELGEIEIRRFPDEETYLRYHTDPAGRAVILLCTLDRPNEKTLPLLFAAATARDLGAVDVGMVCPYLAYMRQDRRFHTGEAVTSTIFPGLLSQEADWLVTIDPHLHRHRSLSEIYSMPATVLHAKPLIADWIKRRIAKPLLIGPDSESEQWVSAVAAIADTPFIVLDKVRHGDRDVTVSVPEVARWTDHTPVIIDDIASSAGTMIETVERLRSAGMTPPVCIAVHGVFAGSAFENLIDCGKQ